MQQQIYIFHINNNVLLQVKSKWKVPLSMVDVAIDDEDGPNAPQFPDPEADAAAVEVADERDPASSQCTSSRTIAKQPTTS
jgi:hypothetical protein